jgi:hypothetical protein
MGYLYFCRSRAVAMNSCEVNPISAHMDSYSLADPRSVAPFMAGKDKHRKFFMVQPKDAYTILYIWC